MIEDDLRAAMLAHDHEAPTVEEFRAAHQRTRRRGRPVWAVAGAALAAAAVVIAVSLIWTRGPARQAATSPLVCPQEFGGKNPSDGWVPAKPRGVDGTKRMAPDRTPSHAVVCAYLQPTHDPLGGSHALSGSRTLTGDLQQATNSLTYLPREDPRVGRACLDYLGMTDGNNYLIGLTYRGGTLWVSAPGNHCAGSSNGTFASTTNLSKQAASAYASGRWPPAEKDATCSLESGRLGDDIKFVPDHPTSVRLCPINNVAKTKAQFATSRGFTPLVNALNDLPTATPEETGICDEHRGQTGNPLAGYTLVFQYDEGPNVAIRIMPNCRPNQVHGGTLEARSSATIRTLVAKLFPGR